MIWTLFIAGILLIICSLCFFYVGFVSVHWPTAQGKVLVSKLLERELRSGLILPPNTIYQPGLYYEYVVNGVTRKSRSIGFYFGTEGKELAEHQLEGRPVGAQVTVYYHPLFPSIAVLEPGIKQASVFIILAVLGIFVTASSAIVLFGKNPYALLDFVFGLFKSITT